MGVRACTLQNISFFFVARIYSQQTIHALTLTSMYMNSQHTIYAPTPRTTELEARVRKTHTSPDHGHLLMGVRACALLNISLFFVARTHIYINKQRYDVRGNAMLSCQMFKIY